MCLWTWPTLRANILFSASGMDINMDKAMGATGVKRSSQWASSCRGRVAGIWTTQTTNAAEKLSPGKGVLETAQYIRRLILNSSAHYPWRNRHYLSVTWAKWDGVILTNSKPLLSTNQARMWPVPWGFRNNIWLCVVSRVPNSANYTISIVQTTWQFLANYTIFGICSFIVYFLYLFCIIF
jgi:hypothetical protein